MHGWMSGWMDDGWTDGWMMGWWMDGCMDGWANLFCIVHNPIVFGVNEKIYCHADLQIPLQMIVLGHQNPQL